jgi:transcriptional regulator with XRE-family HTH domain
MTLKDYLAQEGNSAAKLAEAAKVSVSTIWRAAEGKTLPSRELMRAIIEHTGGAVTPNDFYGMAA